MVEDAYYNIQPLTDLDLINEEPIKIRRFKPKYYLTMGTMFLYRPYTTSNSD